LKIIFASIWTITKNDTIILCLTETNRFIVVFEKRKYFSTVVCY